MILSVVTLAEPDPSLSFSLGYMFINTPSLSIKLLGRISERMWFYFSLLL